ncbi:probable Brh2-Rad51-associated protein Brh2 [Sporisorium reilianum f. sp. reilianum]|uniref:Probable Brh2-Rad51-associated protein Brh2 n=1 Tax=Sporisorium reilianum f. sp. reilianum TaxID=72559 RepID=A0A2N8UEM1_9BASI|nr:probable Brh2-Rad51-associated protein Brh2 [Sporisorium reilianum f. sp. reilianum]
MTRLANVGSPPTATAVSLDDDDELAATQQSILEELHTISEEALIDNSNHNASAVQDQSHQLETNMDLEQPEPASAPQASESQSATQQQAEPSAVATAQEEAALALSTRQIIEASMHAPSPPTPATSDAQVKSPTADPIADAHPQTNGNAKSGPSADTENVAAIALVESLSPEPSCPGLTQLSESILTAPHAAVTAPKLPHLATSQMDADLDFDHADLFDGIEADAFDDIELSPPTRRTVVLPSLEPGLSDMDHRLPASPTRSSNQMRAQSLAEAEFAPDAEDFAAAEPPEMPQPSQMTSFLDPAFAGFKTGHKKPIKLSEKALQAARKLMLELEESTDLLPPLPASQSSPQKRMGATASSSQIAQHSSNGRPAQSITNRAPMQEIIPRQSDSVLNGSASSSVEAKGKAVAVPAALAAQVAPVLPAFATPKQTRSRLLSINQSIASPMRTPAAASGSRFSTPQPSKRVSLGMMPRAELGANSTGRKRSLPRFVTPFKGGKRPRAEDQQDPVSPLRRPDDTANLVLGQTSASAMRQYPPPTQAKQTVTSKGPTVFLMQSSGARRKLAEVGRPEYYTSMQMIAKGVPDEVLVILNDASRAAHYAFEDPDGTLLMHEQALNELQARGCSAVEKAWVQNHWTLILWKLAAMVRFEPSSAPERWSWNEVIRQLLYRYEREVHRAQRSCIKRIQEHDSSASRPMVLLVSKIFQEETEVQDRSGAIVPRKNTILELSDGWYRIQAQIDAVLTRACQRGRLRIGQKLAITGATTDAQGEGKEVLVAYHMSSLVLAANSVSLARWDAKLGFASTPFCASARSLTPEGGLISLMDVVIDKVFPRAFVDVDRSASNSGAPRGEQEEAEEREAWVKRREDAIQRLELEAEAESRRMYDLVEALSDLTGDSFLPTIPDDPNGRLEALANQLFEQLRAQQNPAAAVKEKVVAAGHTILVPWLHTLAKSAILSEDGLVGSSMGAKLDELCPPRKVREFRVVRLKDARLPPPPPPPTAATSAAAAAAQQAGNGGAKPKKNPHARTVKLTVWDVAQLGDELREGRRFLVTNLIPASKSAWRKPDDAGDIFLSTRRDTKWRALS